MIDIDALNETFTSVFGANPGQEDLVERARELVPLLRDNAPRCEAERRITKDNLDALTEAGILKMGAARRYGGREAGMRTRIAVHSEVARGCASTAWVATIYSDVSWFLSLLPDEVQDEVFSTTEGRGCASFTPGASRAVPKDDGFLVTGRWAFQTGSPHAEWALEPALLQNGDGPPELAIFVMPAAQVTVEDDWYTTGLKGSGSNSVSARDVFVPRERVLRVTEPSKRAGSRRSEANAATGLYDVPLPTFILTSVGAFCGLARAALELLVERLPGRDIAYTFYADRTDATVTHLQVAEAASKIRAAHHLFFEVADRIDAHIAARQPYSVEEQTLMWGTVAYAVRLCGEAVDIIRYASGASAIHEQNPMQRIVRDMAALTSHAFMVPTTGLELYGQVLCGRSPGSPLL